MTKTIKISEGVYIIEDRVGNCCNLVIGDERALLFDTCMGIDNIYKAVRSLTDLPLLVINSHTHFDHCGGDDQFEKVYAPKLDLPILEDYDTEKLNKWAKDLLGTNEKIYKQAPKDYGNIYALDFSWFNLGNLECEIIPLPGHTAGSIGILIPSKRLLLSGDALLPITCLVFQNHLGKKEHLSTLQTVKKLDFDYFLTSHHTKAFDKKLVNGMIDCVTNSLGRKHYDYKYPYPPYSEGFIYIDTVDGEPIGIIVDKP